jgi:hypothetical protein
MMLASIWPEGNGGNKPLPAPNVIVARAGTPPEQLSPEAVKGILVNPIYTGLGPFPRLVEDAVWVRACAMCLPGDHRLVDAIPKLVQVGRLLGPAA